MLGDDNPIIVYTSLEKTVLSGLASMYPEYQNHVESIIERLVDLHRIVRANYYHPDMKGSWSIKRVLPTIAPEFNYSGLGRVQSGDAAQTAYLEAISSVTDDTRGSEIESQLRAYCKRDTLGMLTISRWLTTSAVGV